MTKLDKYLFSDFLQSFFATLIVMLLVAGGGVLVDVLGSIANGRFPVTLLFTECGLQFIVYLPLLLPLILMLSVFLSLARLYRDSEMSVIMALGIGPRRLLRPMLVLIIPVVVSVALCGLWLSPWAKRCSNELIIDASRTMVLGGLDPGTFSTLPGRDGGVVYLSTVSDDGTIWNNLFIQRQSKGRKEVVVARRGGLRFDGKKDRFLHLQDGDRIQSPVSSGLDYQVMHFVTGDILLPLENTGENANDPELLGLSTLYQDQSKAASAEMQRRITPAILTLAFALLALPLSRSAPRQQRHGRVLLCFLAYLLTNNLVILGSQWISEGIIPTRLGLWWLSLPLVLLSTLSYVRADSMKMRFKK